MLYTADMAPETLRCPTAPSTKPRPIRVGFAPKLSMYTVDGITVLAYSEADAARVVRS